MDTRFSTAFLFFVGVREELGNEAISVRQLVVTFCTKQVGQACEICQILYAIDSLLSLKICPSKVFSW